MYYGSEFISNRLVEWCQRHQVVLAYIQSGKPNQNAFIERFNRTFRHEVLSAYLFISLQKVRGIAWEWTKDYNKQRPHEALNNLTPSTYREKMGSGFSSLELYA